MICRLHVMVSSHAFADIGYIAITGDRNKKV